MTGIHGPRHAYFIESHREPIQGNVHSHQPDRHGLCRINRRTAHTILAKTVDAASPPHGNDTTHLTEQDLNPGRQKERLGSTNTDLRTVPIDLCERCNHQQPLNKKCRKHICNLAFQPFICLKFRATNLNVVNSWKHGI